MKKQKDYKSNLRELNKFSKKIFDAVKAIMELPETEQMYLWHLVFHYEQYNETSNPKFAQHFIVWKQMRSIRKNVMSIMRKVR